MGTNIIGLTIVWDVYEDTEDEDYFVSPPTKEEHSGVIFDKTSQGYMVKLDNPKDSKRNVLLVEYSLVKRILERGEKIGEQTGIL